MTGGSDPTYNHWNRINSSTNSGWNSLDSAAQNMEIGSSPFPFLGHIDSSFDPEVLQNQGRSSSPQIIQLPSNCFPEMDSFLTQQRLRQIANSADYSQEGSARETEKVLDCRILADNYAPIREGCNNFDEATINPSPDGKKRRIEDCSQFSKLKNLKTDQEKDQCTGEQDEDEPKLEQKPAASKQVKESSTCGDGKKDDHVHVRAKQGQAKSRHSLAERVRREKIRDKMKFLQDLVPGCNKITGKAVMLDEIINYVLSLQGQVEFLSMKLAAVYPDMEIVPEQGFSRDIHHQQGGSAAILGDPRMSSYPKEMQQGALMATQTSNLEPPFMPNLC